MLTEADHRRRIAADFARYARMRPGWSVPRSVPRVDERPVEWLGADPARPVRDLPRWARAAFCLALAAGAVAEMAAARSEAEPRRGFWVTLLLFVASVVLNELLRPKPKIEDARPAGLGDFSFPTATEGRVVPLIWGRNKLDGPNVVWYGDLRQDAIRVTQKTGLWSKKTFTSGFQYYVGVQLAFCRGPITAVRRVWIGEVEAFIGNATFTGGKVSVDIDLPNLLGGPDLGSGGVQGTLDFFEGSNTQPVSAFLDNDSRQRITSAATPTAPAYVGTCHAVFRELGVPEASARGAYVGDRTNVDPVAVELERYPALFAGQSSGENIVVVDANTINVLYELLTNTEWGLGFLPADVDTGIGSSFLSAADTCITEGNGFSMVLDSPLEAVDLLRELERQVDGIVFLDHRTGKWSIKLARDDYDIDLVPQVDESNSTVEDFADGSWEDTTNQIVVEYTKRDIIDDYKQSFAIAQDSANILIQGAGTVLTGKVVSAPARFPGVKSSALAAQLAWRELRTQSFPLARAKFGLDRRFWDVTSGSVIAWSNAEKGFSKLPMRITSLDFGELQSNKITALAVQDVFRFAAPSSGPPPGTGWTPPADNLVAFPANEQLAFEAPRAIVVRDPEFAGDPNVGKFWFSGRRQGNEALFEARQRNAPGTPAGSFAVAGSAISFMRIGALNADLVAGVPNPTSSIVIKPDFDTQAALEEVFDDSATLEDLGVDLAHLILVGTEFMLVRSAANTGPNVALQEVYRGALDSAQQAHLEDDEVYLVFVGGSLSDVNLPTTNNVDVKLIPISRTDELDEASAATISFAMNKRAVRPYAPAAALYNGSASPFGTPNLEGDGSGLNGVGFDVDLWRRRFDAGDELQELLQDNAVSASTEHRVRVFVDPLGANVLVFDSGWFSGASVPVRPTQAQVIVPAAAGTLIRVQSESRHDHAGEVDIESRHSLVHDVVPTSPRTAQFYLGGDLGPLTASNVYTAAASGTFTVNIGAAFATSDVERRINGGTWTVVISAGGTTGTIAGVVTNDTIELRHTVSEGPDPNFVELVDPGSADVAYGAFSA